MQLEVTRCTRHRLTPDTDTQRMCLHRIREHRREHWECALGIGLIATKRDGEKAISEIGEKVKVENVH